MRPDNFHVMLNIDDLSELSCSDLGLVVDLAMKCYVEGVTDSDLIPEALRCHFIQFNGHWFPTDNWCRPQEDSQ